MQRKGQSEAKRAVQRKQCVSYTKMLNGQTIDCTACKHAELITVNNLPSLIYNMVLQSSSWHTGSLVNVKVSVINITYLTFFYLKTENL